MRQILLSFILLTSTYFHAKTDCMRVMFNADASNSATIGWNQLSGTFAALEIATDSSFSLIQTYPITSKNNSKGFHNHFVRLTGLTPNTKYFFRVKDSEETSKCYYFSTVSNLPTERLALIAGGDSRDRREIRVHGNRMVAKLFAHAVLFNGDFTGIDTPSQWKDWFEDWKLATPEDGRITPLVVTRGNHELSNKSITHLFNVPSKKVIYDVQFGGTLLNVVCLNSEIYKFGKQKRFLKNTLKDHQNFSWQMPQYHRPIRSHVSFKKEMETQYRNFVPVFEKYKNVRLCLENDSHTCKSTWPIVASKAEGSAEGFIRNDETGIVYVGEGCWGAPIRQADDAKIWTRNCDAINQVNWIFIDQSKIEVRTVKYENSLSVASLSEATRFNMPEGIDLWSPSNGAVIEIFPRR